MEKLTAADASFLYAETDACTSNIASVNLLELPTGTSEQDFIESLKGYMSERLHLVSYLTRKLAHTPGNWDHPVWVQDDSFDINNHVIEYPVPAPGTMAEIESAVAAIHAEKMDLDRPLWVMWVLTNLENGRVAYYNQIHHAAIDGASGNAAYSVLMDETPDHPEVPAPAEKQAEKHPSPLALLEASMNNFLRYQAEAAERMSGTLETSRKLFARAINPAAGFGAWGKTAPATPFNTTISAGRSWAAGEMPLADVKQIGKTVGATVNDVVMAICAGGLRTYLERSGDLPKESMIAGCPVSLRQPGDTRPGNQVTMMNVDLGTSIEDPVKRLLAIHASAETAKEMTADLAGAFDTNAAMPGLPGMIRAGAQAAEVLGLSRYIRGPVNVVISNVPGPRNTLYSNGARMLSHYPVSIPTHGVGLNITVQSYCDRLYLGITACSEALPDAGLLRDDLLAAYRELKNRLLKANVSLLEPKTLELPPVRLAEWESAEIELHGKVA